MTDYLIMLFWTILLLSSHHTTLAILQLRGMKLSVGHHFAAAIIGGIVAIALWVVMRILS